jgi:hypothetical protein
MKNLLITSSIVLFSFSVFSNNPEPKKWNNKGIEQTFKRGDLVAVKQGTKSAKYVLTGKVDSVCNANYIKVNGYFVAISDIDVITKYYHVK